MWGISEERLLLKKWGATGGGGEPRTGGHSYSLQCVSGPEGVMEEEKAHPAHSCCPCRSQSAAVFVAAASELLFFFLPGALYCQLASILPLPSPPLAVWLRCSGDGRGERGALGDRAPSPSPSSSPCGPRRPAPPPLPAAAANTSSEISIGAQGAGPRRGEWEE